MRAQPTAATLTEQDLLARIERNPRMAVVRARIEAARAEIDAARPMPNPAIAYERESLSGNGRAGAQPEDSIRAVLPIDISGRRGRRIAAAELGAAAATATAERERLSVQLEALDLFYQVAHARLRTETLRADRDQLSAIVSRLRSRARAGDASGYDVSRLELELGDYDDLLASAESELAVGRRSLGLLIGQDGPVDVSESLAVPTDAPSSTSASEESRADLRAARLRSQQGQAEVAAGKRGWWPVFELSGGFKSAGEADARVTGYLAGIGARLPFFDHGQAERARGQARRQLAEAEARVLEVGVPVEVATAREQYTRVVKQAVLFRDAQVPRADTLVRRAESLYREGERPVFELIDAHRTARQVRQRALELRLRAKQSVLDLWQALGRRP